MKRVHKRKSLCILILCLVVGVPLLLADANTDVSITTNGTCANGSTLFVIHNANASSGIIATVQQTMAVSGNTSVSNFDVSLDPAQTKQLGCSVQDPPPATNVQFSWQIQSAHYR